jgi:hypothetical protein
MPVGGLFPAPWHRKVSAPIAGRDRDDVTDGGIGGCKIFPRMATGLQSHFGFADGDVWLPLARAERFQITSHQ